MIRGPVPCLWCDGTLADQAQAYAALFPGATIDGQDAADWAPGRVAMLDLGCGPVALLDGGPMFRPSPALSLALTDPDAGRIRALWDALGDGGGVLVPLGAWPWADLFGWVQDRWGVSWQLTRGAAPGIAPFLTFVGPVAGRARAALALYARAVPGLAAVRITDWDGTGPAPAGWVMQARLAGPPGALILSENADEHAWGFTEGGSLMILCDTQAEVDAAWATLTADGGQPSRCGWLKDPFGVSWQIVPQDLVRILADAPPPVQGRVMAAVLGMGKLDLDAIRAAERA